MACSEYASWSEFIAQGQFFDALVCPFVDSMGIALAGLMVFGTIGLALYIYSGGIELPLVVGIIVGAGVVTQVPAIASQIVGIVLVLGIALAGYVLIMRLNASR